MKNKVLNSIFSFAVILVIALSLCFGFVSKDIINAEAVSPMDNFNADFSEIDLSYYPGANYFDVSQISVTTGDLCIYQVSNGITNSVVVARANSGKSGYVSTEKTLMDICPGIKIGTPFTLSYDCSFSSASVKVGSKIWNNGSSMILTTNELVSPISFYVEDLSGGYYTNFIYREITINNGTQAYPYMPCFNTLANIGGSSEEVYNEGFSAGRQEGYTAGVNDGRLAGQQEGYNTGREEGLEEGYNEGIADGYRDGHEDGYDTGYQQGLSAGGYDLGYADGYEVGSDEGYEEGFNDCREDMKGTNDYYYELGYDQGFTAGQNTLDADSMSQGIKTFVFALFDAPVSTFTSIFDFEVGDFDLGGLVSFIFSLVVVGGVLKLVL